MQGQAEDRLVSSRFIFFPLDDDFFILYIFSIGRWTRRPGRDE